MRSPVLVLLFITIAGLCLSAGCISGTGQNPGGTTPATQTAPATIPPAAMLIPGPTQTLPPDYYITVDVQKQGQSGIPTITVIFRGGTGQIFTTQLTVKVTRSDGQVITKSMNHPNVGDEVDIEGTAGNDRVEITDLVSTGGSYKIYDELLPYQSVNK